MATVLSSTHKWPTFQQPKDWLCTMKKDSRVETQFCWSESNIWCNDVTICCSLARGKAKLFIECSQIDLALNQHSVCFGFKGVRVQGNDLNSKFSRSRSEWKSLGCTRTSPINWGPMLQSTELKGTTANALVPDNSENPRGPVSMSGQVRTKYSLRLGFQRCIMSNDCSKWLEFGKFGGLVRSSSSLSFLG